MNKSHNIINNTTAPLKITISPKGLKVSKSTTLPVLTNIILNALIQVAIVVTGTSEAAKTENYEMFSTAFSNFLAAFSPADHFPSRETLEAELEAESKALEAKVAMGLGSDIDFNKLKEKQKQKMAEAKAYMAEHPEDVISL